VLKLAASVLLVAQLVLGTGPPAAAAGRIGQDWPMFHRDPLHQGVSPDTAIGASDVASLTIRWQANIGASSGSPALVYNAALAKTLVYIGNLGGTFAAYDAQTGTRVWFFSVGAPIYSSPAVDGNVVYFGSNNHFLYALNATTGALICRHDTGSVIFSSPVVADPDGTGKVVYVGDSGITGADDGGDILAMNGVDPNAAQDCSTKWSYGEFGDPPGSQPLVGVWSPPAFARDVNGRALIVAGGGSPEGAVYALDAVTGARVWRFQSEQFAADQDVGVGPTISPPGVNGFVDGVAYVAGKDSIAYALNLRTGAKIWQYRIRDDAGPDGHTRSTAALVGRTLFMGNGPNVELYAIDAITGAKVWSSSAADPTDVLSSPAVTGASGDQVFFVGNVGGTLFAHSLDTGAVLWSYDTGRAIHGSAAISGGMVFIANAGFLDAFGFGGGASAPPETRVTSPANGSTVTNPNGSLTVSGSATDDAAVTSVLVSVRDEDRGLYWDGTTGTWKKVLNLNAASLAQPGRPTTTWTYRFPAPRNGGPFTVTAEAVDPDGQHDPSLAQTEFSLTSLTKPPDTTIGSPRVDQLFTFPNGRQSFNITITGTATDTMGTKPGVATVYVVVENLEHGEYFCGPPGCGGGETGRWKPVWFKVAATLANPGAKSTTWTLTFSTYDHPHTYSITAWAVDRNGNPDPFRATVSTICVKDPGATTCP
jgi:outer membrane protein assembly factor BamB